MDYVKRELSRGIGDWEQRLSTALVKSSPTDLVRSASHAPSAAHPPAGETPGPADDASGRSRS